MQKTTVFSGDNPTAMYVEALQALVSKGDELAPRGKRIKELRPTIFEFHNPLKRVTFVKGRVINPFFQLAESFWIAFGGSDVEFLRPYNKSIEQFSDDGVFFNAPYGERLRTWGKNDARGLLFNPVDQLGDVYEKLKADKDTRQAVAFIGNPHFDSSEYTLNGGKDIACNINIKFKIRDNQLDINVDNRSNDLHWGVFGANLCQFTTIQELMASWLGIPVGTYYQSTDSLHIYLDDYGAKETDKVLNHYPEGSVQQYGDWAHLGEPRMSCSFEEFNDIVMFYFQDLHDILNDEAKFAENYAEVLHNISTLRDSYFRMTFQAMFVKQAYNYKIREAVFAGMMDMESSSWRISCLRFLSKRYKDVPEFKALYQFYKRTIVDYIERKEV